MNKRIVHGKGRVELLNRIKQEKQFQNLKLAFQELKQKYNIGIKELKFLIKEEPTTIDIPITAFHNTRLSCLEITCKYLKEEHNLKLSTIAKLLNRNQRTIWTTYKNSLTKQKQKLTIKETHINIPTEIFSDRRFSTLENITKHLKEQHNIPLSQISTLLQKDPRNIWTVYSRYKKKENEVKSQV